MKVSEQKCIQRKIVAQYELPAYNGRMTKMIRWGLLSTARINRRLIPVIRQSERGELAAVASRSLASAEKYAADWQIPKTFGSYDALLDSDAIDAVYIGLPNHLHAEWTIKALLADKHVLCEKPFALTLEEVDAMTATANQMDRVLMEAFMYRHHPQMLQVRELIDSGALGEVQVVQSAFNFKMGSRDNVRLVPEYGGGALWDVGIYPVSVCNFIFGAAPTAVQGCQWLGASGIDETFMATMQYAGGRYAQFTCGFRSPYHTHLTILGSAGRLELTRPFNGVNGGEATMTLFRGDGDGDATDLPVSDKPLYLGQVENMHAAILDGGSTRVTLGESRAHVRTALALYHSAETGETITLAPS